MSTENELRTRIRRLEAELAEVRRSGTRTRHQCPAVRDRFTCVRDDGHDGFHATGGAVSSSWTD